MRTFNVKVNGVLYEVEVEETGTGNTADSSAKTVPNVSSSVPSPKSGEAVAGNIKVKAPMPGKLIKINCKAGQSVKRGEILCLLEAMKMENEIFAPCDGTIATVEASQGDTVAGDALLFTLKLLACYI